MAAAARDDGETTALAVIKDLGYDNLQVALIKAAANARDMPDDELAVFLATARRTGLDPVAKQIYAIPRNQKRGDKWQTVWTIQTGIDGYRLIAQRTEALAGIDDAVFDTEDAEHPERATVTVWRFVQGMRVSFTATARWREYVQTNSDGKPSNLWARMPYGQLAKCAEALALRKGFPAELSGLYTDDEMDQAANTARPAAPRVTVVSPAGRTVDADTGEVLAAEPEPERDPDPIAGEAKRPSWADLKARALAVGLSEDEWKDVVTQQTGGKIKGFTNQDWRDVSLYVRRLEDTKAQLDAEKAAASDPDLLRNHPALQGSVRP